MNIRIHSTLTTDILLSVETDYQDGKPPRKELYANCYGDHAKFIARVEQVDDALKAFRVARFESEMFIKMDVNINNLWIQFDKKVEEYVKKNPMCMVGQGTSSIPIIKV